MLGLPKGFLYLSDRTALSYESSSQLRRSFALQKWPIADNHAEEQHGLGNPATLRSLGYVVPQFCHCSLCCKIPMHEDIERN